MDFVVERPLTAFPGGEPALLRTLGEMVTRLQATAPFPPVMEDFGVLVEAMLNLVRDGGLFAPGVLDGHVAGLARVRAEYPWAAAQVSAHNDINPRNVLFDGERLWLVDWEMAFRNDPLADVANIANNFSEVPDVDTLVLEGWLGRSPDDDTRRRLTLMRDLQRLFAGCLLLSEFIGRRGPEAELTATDARRVPRRDHAWRATRDARAALRARQDAPRRLRRRGRVVRTTAPPMTTRPNQLPCRASPTSEMPGGFAGDRVRYRRSPMARSIWSAVVTASRPLLFCDDPVGQIPACIGRWSMPSESRSG